MFIHARCFGAISKRTHTCALGIITSVFASGHYFFPLLRWLIYSSIYQDLFFDRRIFVQSSHVHVSHALMLYGSSSVP